MIVLVLLVLALGLLVFTLSRSSQNPPNAPPLAKVSFLPAAMDYGRDPIKFLMTARKRFGDVFSISLTPSMKWTFLLNTDSAKAFFNAPNEELSFEEGVIQFVGHIFGKDMYSLDDEWHAIVNKVITKGFMQPPALALYSRWMDEITSETLTRLGSLSEFDLFAEMSALIIRITMRCMIGAAALQKYGAEFAKQYGIIEAEAFKPIVIMAPWFPSQPARRLKAARERLEVLIGEILTLFRSNAVTEEDGQTYVGMIMREYSGSKYAPRVLVNHVLSILFAAHTNSAATLGWAVTLLTQHPHWLERVRDEQRSVIEKEGAGFTFDTPNQLQFLDAVMKETIRLRGILVVFRAVKNDWPLTLPAGMIVPKGHFLVMCPQIIHQDPKNYPQPEKFDPTRFDSAEKIQSRKNDYTYIQFGFGRHHCLGEKFANLELKMTWSKLYRNYDVEFVSGGDSAPDYAKAVGSPWPISPVIVRLKKLSKSL